jgi:hypothetical protein
LNAGKTNIFLTTNAVLCATNVTVNGTMTHSNFVATVPPWAMEHWVWVACSNFTLASGGKIDAVGMGWPGGATNKDWGKGPGGGGNADQVAAGAGHGGIGGRGDYLSGHSAGGVQYDSTNAPALAGSGGGAGNPQNPQRGGAGGGRIAVISSRRSWHGTTSVTNGVGDTNVVLKPLSGTVYFNETPLGSLFIIR